MGLTIRWSLQICANHEQAVDVVHALHRRAGQLGFDELSPVCKLPDDPGGLVGSVCSTRQLRDGRLVTLDVPPLDSVWFHASTCGAETARFGLARHPSAVRFEGRSVSTGLEHRWSWQASCKTQYAALPQYGGIGNLLRAHLQVVALLDEARDLGLKVAVHDDGGYWDHRDIDALVSEVDRWNRMVALLGRLVIEDLGDEAGPPSGPILKHPDFDELAQGPAPWSRKRGQTREA